MRKVLKVAIALVLCTSPVLSQRAKPLSDPEMAEITARGRLLAEYDEASWHATDAVFALKPENGSFEKYVARKTDSGWVVVFGRFNEVRDSFLVVYEAIQGSDPLHFMAKKYDPPANDTTFYFIAARALETSLNEFRGEKRPYNTYVIPANANQLYVYVLPAQTVDGVYPLGGDVRYLVSADGSKIIETRRLHKTILEMKKPENSGKVESGYHSHVLSDVPEDTDVFHVLRQKPPIPEIVGTKSFLYIVHVDGSIHSQKSH
ncbi:MAG: hypothetical protein NVS9B13_10670 [Candidatus Acidiferrum sp.]